MVSGLSYHLLCASGGERTWCRWEVRSGGSVMEGLEVVVVEVGGDDASNGDEEGGRV
jgi:hypothetical protein